MTAPRIMIVDDEERLRKLLAMLLSDMKCKLTLAEDGRDALEKYRQARPDLVITDLKMPRMGGLELLNELQQSDPDLPVIVITAFGSVESAVEAMKAGAVDYITKPFEEEVIKLAVRKALRLRRLLSENVVLRGEARGRYDFQNIVAESAAMKEILQLAAEVAPTSSTVLLTGESGTGKEIVTRAIHNASARSGGRFVALNCAAIPENLLESELFGHERGAFTGAVERKKGKFELADGGTIFLDEIGEMSPALQAKILRVLEEREFERVGGEGALPTDVRVIAATSRDLPERIRQGAFREDLFFRISVFPLHLPPLRERREDIMPLARLFLERFTKEMGRRVSRIPQKTERLLAAYSWPGNVRELQNYIERAVILLKGEELIPALFPPAMTGVGQAGENAGAVDIDLPSGGLSLEELERSLIVQALERSGNNKTEAAKLLGLSRATLRYRLEKHGIKSGKQ
jgi:DNA-binding NtrC family response regulator